MHFILFDICVPSTSYRNFSSATNNMDGQSQISSCLFILISISKILMLPLILPCHRSVSQFETDSDVMTDGDPKLPCTSDFTDRLLDSSIIGYVCFLSSKKLFWPSFPPLSWICSNDSFWNVFSRSSFDSDWPMLRKSDDREVSSLTDCDRKKPVDGRILVKTQRNIRQEVRRDNPMKNLQGKNSLIFHQNWQHFTTSDKRCCKDRLSENESTSQLRCDTTFTV